MSIFCPIPHYVNLTSYSLYKTLNIPFIYSHSSIVMLTGLHIKSLSERTKSSWSLLTLARFIFITTKICSSNTGLVRDSQKTLGNIFILLSHYQFQHFIYLKIYLLILYPYMGVPQTVHLH